MLIIMAVSPGPAFLASAGSLPFRLEVLSRYQNLFSEAESRENYWLFSLKPSSSSNRELMEISSRGTVFARLFFKDGTLFEVEERLTAAKSRQQKFSPPLALSAGYPVPYDWLAPGETHDGELSIKTEAGETSFLFMVTKTTSPMDLSEAIKNKMIDSRIQGLLSAHSPLKLIEVWKRDKFLIKQLWSPELNWWIYEETPERKSWLIAYQP